MTDDSDQVKARLLLLQNDINAVFLRHLPPGVDYSILLLCPGPNNNFSLECCSTMDHRRLKAMLEIMLEKTKEHIEMENMEMLMRDASSTQH